MEYIHSSSGTDYKRGHRLNLTLIKTGLYSMSEEVKQRPLSFCLSFSSSIAQLQQPPRILTPLREWKLTVLCLSQRQAWWPK